MKQFWYKLTVFGNVNNITWNISTHFRNSKLQSGKY